MVGPVIKRILLEKGAEDFGATARIVRGLGGHIPERVVAPSDVEPFDPRDMDKESLRLVSFPGQLLKPCPGTNNYICCGYQILHVGTNCPLDCSYCVLQAYFNQPSLRVFVNLESELIRILDHIDRHPEKIFRVGTGEFTDSLALDPIAGWSDILLPPFSVRKNAVLELKTKTLNIKRLISSKERDRIIVSWSLNSPYVTSREEHGAPGIRKRLEAARRCQEEGFTLGFHFDPMIEHPGWKEGYLRTLDMLDEMIDPKRIIWMSLGTIRFMPALKNIIRKRHPDTHILDGEFVPGLDGKMRYFKPIRIDMYAFMRGVLAAWHQDLGLYLCMESDEVWQKGLGWSPTDSEGLARFLDGRVTRFFA